MKDGLLVVYCVIVPVSVLREDFYCSVFVCEKVGGDDGSTRWRGGFLVMGTRAWDKLPGF